MVELPTELWLRIALFVPDIDLFRLASVNHLFLDLVTDRRYRQLIIDDDRPAVLLNKLAKLHPDSPVAARVRSLTIHPKAVRSACIKSARTTKSRVRPAKSKYWPENFRRHSEKFPIVEDVELADTFLSALSSLHSIEEFTIEWKQGVEAERSFCLPLLSAIWPLFSQNLRTIKLDMMLSHLADMVSSLKGLDKVQDLVLNFTCDDGRFGHWGGPPGQYEAKYAFEQLAGFVNRLALSLKTLTISSIGHLNFSWLYSNLTFFPHLTSLSLLLPCDPRHVVDPTGFHHFLRAHRGVEHLHFSPQYCCYQSTQHPAAAPSPSPSSLNNNSLSHPHPSHPSHNHNHNHNHNHHNHNHHNHPSHSHSHSHSPNTSSPTTVDEWLSRTFDGLTFTNLLSLELGLNILGSGGKRVMLPVPRIALAAATGPTVVKQLVIVGCVSSLDDLHSLLAPFSASASGTASGTGYGSGSGSASHFDDVTRTRTPRNLVLEVHVLNVTLLDLLADLLPGLEMLDLTYRWIGDFECVNATAFTEQLRHRQYEHWKLWKLVLRCSRQNDDARWPSQQAISRSVPGLR